MSGKLYFIHTVSGLENTFRSLCEELIPQVRNYHIADESIIQRMLAAGGLTPVIYRRICEHVVAAEDAGAEVIQLTCSSISPTADIAQHLVAVPVLKIDEPMVAHAVQNYERICVLATAHTTLQPTTQLVHQKAAHINRKVVVSSSLCEGAYDAFLAGDLEKHDAIVRDYLHDSMKNADVVMLAQASMSRIADMLSDREKIVPIVSSPRSAIERVAQKLTEISSSHFE